MDEDIVIAETSPVEIPPKRGGRWVFWGKEGLRAGWGVLLFIVLVFVFEDLSYQVVKDSIPTGHISVMSLKLGATAELSQLIPVILATVIMALIERRPIVAYGYQGEARLVRFLSGLVVGFVALSALVGILWKAHLLAFDGATLHGAAIWKYGIGWGLVFLTVGLFEESTLRGYLQFTLSRGIGFWWGAILLSFLFGFSHGTQSGETPVGLFSVGAVGLVFCLSLWYTGSLWWAVGCHAGWDWAQSYFYGTSDSGLIAQGHLLSEHPIGPRLWSGGATGPEGSLMAMGVLAVMALSMWLWWGRHLQLQSPFSESGWRPAWSRKPALPPPADLAA